MTLPSCAKVTVSLPSERPTYIRVNLVLNGRGVVAGTTKTAWIDFTSMSFGRSRLRSRWEAMIIWARI